MERNSLRAAIAAATVGLTFGLMSGCSDNEAGFSNEPVTRTVVLKPGPNASIEALSAFVGAQPGDTIQFECGFYAINQTLLLSNSENITVRGCSRDGTVLSFRNSSGVEGILVDNVNGITVEDMTVADPSGNGVEMRSVDHGTISRLRAYWSSGGGNASADPLTAENYEDGRLNIACTNPAELDPSEPGNADSPDAFSPDYTVSDKSGRYGIYPVRSKNILIDNVESIGASDAGIYVGQTNNAIIRNSRAAFNVFGFEIENVQQGEYDSNVAECNTGGFLIYDLPGITQYGEGSRMLNNVSRMNNTYNFTEGGLVANVPSGSGMITLAYDRIDVFDNEFSDNNTGGIIHGSYLLFPVGAGRPAERKIDFFTEGMRIYRNTFRRNGGRLPEATEEVLGGTDFDKILPAVMGLKAQVACNITNPTACLTDDPLAGYRGAHIIWDGALDTLDEDCPYPLDENGAPVEMHPSGKPRHRNTDPNPACHYNAYKFDTAAEGKPLKAPEWFASCIDGDNDFGADSLSYLNFQGTDFVEEAIGFLRGLIDPADNPELLQAVAGRLDLSVHDCVDRFGSNLAPLPAVVIEPFEPSGNFDPLPTAGEIAALCNTRVADGEVNFAAAKVDCPTLDQYKLFADAEDPTSTPNGDGVPFVLNSKLFSDYSVKYRVAYLPPGAVATYQDSGNGMSENASIVYPTGTIIAKTFSFVDATNEPATETAIETRLIIKREMSNGQIRWAGLPYVWSTENGRRVAKLQNTGATVSVSWNYDDPDPQVTQNYSGSTAAYSVPDSNQCLSCHVASDKEAGVAPIGPKVRNLNRPYRSESPIVTDQSQHEIAGQNQLAYLCTSGRLVGCPANLGVNTTTQIAANLERNPKFNVPGDAGFAAGSDQDIEARARSWLEVNCQHCHNDKGFAANTGFYTDVFRAVDLNHGICKGPTAAGAEGTDGRTVDIFPGDASRSILEYRISEDADTPAARMPPIARSVVDEEGHSLIMNWINNVIDVDEQQYPGSGTCTSR